MVISPSEKTAIDNWRREKTDMPSRSEAIRRLVALGLLLDPEAVEKLDAYLAPRGKYFERSEFLKKAINKWIMDTIPED